MEYVRNIQALYPLIFMIRNTGAAFGGAPMGRPPSAAALWVCVSGCLWFCESNREIIGFLCCEWVWETRCFLSLGRAAATCAPALLLRSFSLVFSR